MPALRDEMPRLIHAEWVKLRTQRSVWWTLAGFTVPTAALVIGMAQTTANVPAGGDSLLAPIVTTMLLMQIGVAVIGALFVSNEYNHGMIRTSFTMAPRRLRFLGAKLTVMTALGLALGLASASISVVLSTAFGGGSGSVDATVLRAVLGAGCYLGTLGAFATATAMLLRHTAGVVLTMIGVVYVLPLVVFPLVPALATAGEFWPTVIGLSVVLPDGVSKVEPWLGWVVFAVQTAALAALSAAVVNRRDA
ncbi:hypothetical protein ADK67_47790 [Saccharothrix sp. NRRL B-16348]|uniref:ABC transporter permease n=1 Tax=Saccharothrix sp. NRRL B-16348 TaxID=1415542 RepID=UPI0006AE7DEC|nr:ABC transporter permease [Saccharothrix sp. NRRL B-16348]KOX11987.1 hypothetical protein ADK67_47790 [Saccharothrix sp. NRRL B-16348]